jgi:hypothetical protein
MHTIKEKRKKDWERGFKLDPKTLTTVKQTEKYHLITEQVDSSSNICDLCAGFQFESWQEQRHKQGVNLDRNKDISRVMSLFHQIPELFILNCFCILLQLIFGIHSQLRCCSLLHAKEH